MNKVLLICLCVFTLSCSKQESPTIDSGEVRTTREIERLEACTQVNFNHGVLLHRNALLMFKCTKWDEEFPHMYRAMKTIQRDSWDHLIGPIDLAFIENKTRRDRFFKNIRVLDANNGLDDLSYVIVALNETNFFDSVKEMFKCVESPGDESCASRKVPIDRIPQKKSLKNIIKLVDVNAETIDRAKYLLKVLVKTMSDRQEDVRNEINKFRTNPLYVPLRLALFDALVSKVKVGLSTEDRKFLSKVLLTGNAISQEPWLYQWLQSLKMNRQKFRDLLEYPVLVNPEFVSEFKGLKKAYDSHFSCSIKHSTSPNDLLSFDLKDYLGQTVSIIKKATMKNYYDLASEGIVGLKMSSEICSEIERNKFGVNLISALAHFSHLVSDKNHYELIRFLLTQSTAKGDLSGSFAENLYLADLITGNIFESFNTLNGAITASTREFYPLIYDTLKNMPPEAYINLGELIESSLHFENDSRMTGVADYWNFFTDEEKNFIFNFLDRHFDKETNYILLFDFYTKFLDELKEVQPSFKESWMGSEEKVEMSYLTLQNFFTQLAGKETLLDFKKFFGRDQILKVLEVISNGQQINIAAKATLNDRYSDDYIRQSQTDRYVFQVIHRPDDNDNDSSYDSRAIIECMQMFSEIENGFYELVRKLPAACSKVTNENMAFRFYGWLNNIENSFLAFKKGSLPNDSLLNNNGMLSPFMLNSILGTSKILDSIMGPVGSMLPTKNGLTYFMDGLKHHLVEKNAAKTIEKNLATAELLLEVTPAQNLVYRNAVLKRLSREDVFSESRLVFGNLAKLSEQYADWIKKEKEGKHSKAQSYSLGKYDPNSTCLKVINQVVSPNPCPGTDVIKKHTAGILKHLTTTYDQSLGSPLGQLLKALKPGEGLSIPHNGKKTRKYRMTLKEMFQYFYDASDKKLAINNKKMLYVSEDGQASYQIVTTLEGIETVIREVRFGNNYLGVAFLNAIVAAENYNKEAMARRKLLAMCIKIPFIRCGRPMSKNDLRMAKNSLEAFDSLIDINNGKGLEPRLVYGNYLSTFEQTLVASSPKKSQAVQLLPLNEKRLLQHNGRLLGEMTLMTMWSNVARVIRDRIGRSRESFDAFINSSQFARVDSAFMYGFNLDHTAVNAERLIKKIQVVPAGESENLLSHTIDWAANLSYEDSRLIEDTIARLMLVGSYLGPAEVVFPNHSTLDSVESNPKYENKYKDNNLFQMFLAVEKIIDFWPTLKNLFPKDATLVDAIKPINTALVFITSSLLASSDPQKNIAYNVLNDVFRVLQSVLFENYFENYIEQQPDVNGLKLLLSALEKPNIVAEIYNLARENYKLLGQFHENQGAWFAASGLNLGRIVDSKKVDMTPFRDYLNFTTKRAVCLAGEKTCSANYHYDELASLVKYLNLKSAQGQTHFMIMIQKVLSENFTQLNAMLDNLLTSLKIVEVRPPLAIQ